MSDESTPSTTPTNLIQAIIQSEAGISLSSFIANVVGVAGGDWLAMKRKENLERLAAKFEERRKLPPGETTPIGPRVGMKGLRAGADEDRREMQELLADDREAYYHEVYEEFVRFMVENNESTEGLTHERFATELRANTAELMSRADVKDVQFSIYLKDGKAACVARVVRGAL